MPYLTTLQTVQYLFFTATPDPRPKTLISHTRPVSQLNKEKGWAERAQKRILTPCVFLPILSNPPIVTRTVVIYRVYTSRAVLNGRVIC